MPHAFCSDDFQYLQEQRWGAIPRLSSFPKLPTLPPELSPHRFTCRALATHAWAQKALLRTRPIRLGWGNIGRDYVTRSRLRTPNGTVASAPCSTMSLPRRTTRHDRLRGVVRRTRATTCDTALTQTAHDVWLKLENEQLTGSFKIRGAFNAIASLVTRSARRVVTASAGNHGRGVARPRSIRIPRRLRPAHGPAWKSMAFATATRDRRRVRALRRAHSRSVAFARNSFLLDPAAEPPRRWAGTVALEIVEQLPDVRSIMVPLAAAAWSGDGAFLRACDP